MRARTGFQKRTIGIRYQRFETDQSSIQAIVRHTSSRCSCFWLGIGNISSSGVAAEHRGLAFIPFIAGDLLELTLDTSCRVFSRPIHLTCVVVRREDRAGEQILDLNHIIFGLEIVAVDELHTLYWQQGLGKLGNPLQTEP